MVPRERKTRPKGRKSKTRISFPGQPRPCRDSLYSYTVRNNNGLVIGKGNLVFVLFPLVLFCGPFLWSCFSVPQHLVAPSLVFRSLSTDFRPPVNHPVNLNTNLNPYSRTMQHLVMLSRLLQCLIVVSLLLSRIPTSMIYGGPSNIWSCFQDHFKTLYYFDGPCFQAQFSITEFYLGSPARQKQSRKSWTWTGKQSRKA